MLLVAFLASPVQAQAPEKPTSSEIFHEIQRLNFLGSVLYIAAHPDDENTRMISYLANGLHARTAYLSLTRGDGGQNLIGPELREGLGLIRTNELVEARKIDGGQQFFTRANDFGYSKHPDETLKIWDKKEVLADMVHIIREYRPDVIINRFDHRTPGTTHGHHTSSAMLAMEAFDLAADPNAYAYQLRDKETWRTARQFFNTSWWFYGSREKFAAADKSNLIEVPTGEYYPLLGESNTEIAARSRSSHRSQGFGNTGTRGATTDWLELLRGSMPMSNDPFDGIDTTWNRVNGGSAIGKILTAVERDFDIQDPAASVPQLLEARRKISALQDAHWREIKLAQIDKIITDCLGLFVEASTNVPTATAGSTVPVRLELTNRSNLDVKVLNNVLNAVTANLSLGQNESKRLEAQLEIADDAAYSSPYWLTLPASLGMYHIPEDSLTGQPINEGEFSIDFTLQIGSDTVTLNRPVVHKFNDPVTGENYQPFYVVPAASVAIKEDVYLFRNGEPQLVEVEVKSMDGNLAGDVYLSHPVKWKVTPARHSFNLNTTGETKKVQFLVRPDGKTTDGTITAIADAGGRAYTQEVVEIAYDHIPAQQMLVPAKARAVDFDLQTRGKRIVYINGAGDSVGAALHNMGYEVAYLDAGEITRKALAKADAVVIGIRTYNIEPAMASKHAILMDYVYRGGTVLTQYNTSRGLKSKELGPFPITLSRKRVTDETAIVKIINTSHPVLNSPNKITEGDFQGWVQERGLYFPNEYDPQYTTLFVMADPGEEASSGNTLVAQHGDGHFIYTGLSFFRQLPAGVPGAYRILANFVSLGNE